MTLTPNRRVLTVTLLFLSGIPLSACGRGRAANSQDARKAVQARVVPVEHRQIKRDVESVGSLFALEEVTVSSEVEGKVDRVLVDVGDRVARQQPLVTVVPVELELAVEQQRASLRQICARLGLEGDGEDLRADTEAAEVKRAAADLSDAEQKFHRAQSLFDEGLIARGTFEEAEARSKSAHAAYDMAVQGIGDQRAELARRRAALVLAEKKLADAVIRAPFAGHVKQRSVTPGQYLRVQTPVMVVVSTDPLRARLKVPEKVAGWISIGGSVKVRVESFPDRVFVGKVSRMSPSVDTQTRSLEVEALLENGEGLLKPGYFVKAVIGSEQVADALFVPYEAVRYVFGVYKVYTVDGARLKEREIKLGERTGESVEVLQGLAEKERVALPPEGQELAEGLTVEAAP